MSDSYHQPAEEDNQGLQQTFMLERILVENNALEISRGENNFKFIIKNVDSKTNSMVISEKV